MTSDYLCLLAIQTLNTTAQALRHLVTEGASEHIPPSVTRFSRSRTAELYSAAWPGLLAAYARLVTSNLANDLFSDCLDAMATFTLGCSMLGLETPRDAFLTTLARSAVPPPLVAAVQRYNDPPLTPRPASVVDNFAMTMLSSPAGSSAPPTLSYRNLRCLQALVMLVTTPEVSLGGYWYNVLETLQAASNVLTVRRLAAGRKVGASTQSATGTRTTEDTGRSTSDLADLAEEQIGQIFAMTPSTSDADFGLFLHALIQLSNDMMGLHEQNPVEDITSEASKTAKRQASRVSVSISSIGDIVTDGPPAALRRTSGLRIQLSQEEQSFSLDRLRAVSISNITRLTATLTVFDAICLHLLSACQTEGVQLGVKKQAADVLGDLIATMFQGLQEDCKDKSGIQTHGLGYLASLICDNLTTLGYPAEADVRSRGLATLATILETSGDTIVAGWDIILRILADVCPRVSSARAPLKVMGDPPAYVGSIAPQMTIAEVPSNGRISAGLVRLAFPTLTLISSDYWSSLDQEGLTKCIDTLEAYASQDLDVNISLSAIGCLWNVSDSVRQTNDSTWVGIMRRLADLALDARHEVRMSALQTFFRCVEAHGQLLHTKLWTDICECVSRTLVRLQAPHSAISGGSASDQQAAHVVRQETQSLALASTSSLVQQYYDSKIRHLGLADRFCEKVLTLCVDAFKGDEWLVVDAALKCATTICVAATTPGLRSAAVRAFNRMHASLSAAEVNRKLPYTQRSLALWLDFCAAIAPTLGTTDLSDASQATPLLHAIRDAVQYRLSPDFAPDTDKISQVQGKALALLAEFAAHSDDSAISVLGLLAQFLRLPFESAFDYHDPFFPKADSSRRIGGRVSYVGMWKTAAPYATRLAVEVHCKGHSSASAAPQVVAIIEVSSRVSTTQCSNWLDSLLYT